mmetsp:Transcript_20089/g.27281  ORF Transcript_20089/g.27281 Transcript_20089/m.27281 type:complete len:429 (-) Transcript_20089:392-1678(-)
MEVPNTRHTSSSEPEAHDESMTSRPIGIVHRGQPDTPNRWHKTRSNSAVQNASNDIEAGRDSVDAKTYSLRILGFEIGHMSAVRQYAVCTGILFFFTILYGALQELVAIHIFERRHGLFVTLIQFFGYTFFAFLQWVFRENNVRSSVPVVYLVILAVLQASMQGLSNLSMRYLTYPAKVLFKSSRVIPTMIFGVIFYGKRYSITEYLIIVIMVFGLATFLGADANASPEFHPIGVGLISLSLIVDAAIINLQEHLFSKFNCDEEEMIFMSYAGGSIVLLITCIGMGEVMEGLSFVRQHQDPVRILTILTVFAACGFCGVSSVTALTKRFGALTAALTTTARKALTILVSFFLFPKPINGGHIFGSGIFILGLVLKSRSKGVRRRTASALPDAEESPHKSSHLVETYVPRSRGLSTDVLLEGETAYEDE